MDYWSDGPKDIYYFQQSIDPLIHHPLRCDIPLDFSCPFS
jgi:hypothetical protein